MIFSTDFLLSLIIVTMIVGISAELMDVQETRLDEKFREAYFREKKCCCSRYSHKYAG